MARAGTLPEYLYQKEIQAIGEKINLSSTIAATTAATTTTAAATATTAATTYDPEGEEVEELTEYDSSSDEETEPVTAKVLLERTVVWEISKLLEMSTF